MKSRKYKASELYTKKFGRFWGIKIASVFAIGGMLYGFLAQVLEPRSGQFDIRVVFALGFAGFVASYIVFVGMSNALVYDKNGEPMYYEFD